MVKGKENPKLFHTYVRNRLSGKEQILRLKALEGRVIETEEENIREVKCKTPKCTHSGGH